MADKEVKIERVLDDIKKLLILQLVNSGVQSKEIASILKVDPAVISRLVPRRKKLNG